MPAFWTVEVSVDSKFGLCPLWCSSKVCCCCGLHLQHTYGAATFRMWYSVWFITSRSPLPGRSASFSINQLTVFDSLSIIIVFVSLIFHLIDCCSASVAKKLHEECFALIFGINTLVALFLQSLLTFIVITHLNLPLRAQYQLYSGIFFLLALIYGLTAVTKTLSQRTKSYQLDC